MQTSNWFFGALALVAASVGFGVTTEVPEAPQEQAGVLEAAPYSAELRYTIFFAALEGLYRDGVSTEIVAKILEIDPTTKYPVNFVWACPICMPVLDALDVYRVRPVFRSEKVPTNTLGTGLSPVVTEAIEHGDVSVRHEAIKSLLEGWIRTWIEAHRLTPKEQAKFQDLMARGRKQGMDYLENYRSLGGSYASLKKCPSCEAGNGAFGNK